MNRLLFTFFLLLNLGSTSFATSVRLTSEEAFHITPKKLEYIIAYAHAQKPTRQTVHWISPRETKLNKDYSRKFISYPYINSFYNYGEAADVSEKLDIGDSVFIKVHNRGFGKAFIGLASGSCKDYMRINHFSSSTLPLGYLGLAYERNHIDYRYNKSQNYNFLISESATKKTFTQKKFSTPSSFVIGFHLKEGQNHREFLVQISLNGTIISHGDLVPADFEFPLHVSAFIPQEGKFEIIDIFHSGLRAKREKLRRKAEQERLVKLKEERTDPYSIEDIILSKKGVGPFKKYFFFIKDTMERPWTVSKSFYTHAELVLIKARGEQRKQLAKPKHLRSKIFVTVDTGYLENYRKANKEYNFETNPIFGIKVEEPSEEITNATVVVETATVAEPIPVALVVESK